MPKFNFNLNFIPVPTDFIENNMISAPGSYVKVYLLSLALGFNGEEMTTASLAEKLNMLESDTVNALKYWDKEGALTYDGNSVTFGADAPKADSGETTAQAKPEKKSMREIAEEMTSNKALAELCELSQEILGKQLKNRDIETLYWFYDELGLSPEVITILLEYCVSKGKRSMSYIEKTAISWHKNGIFTIEAADKLLESEKNSDSYTNALKKYFGFGDRNLSKTEETYFTTWRDKYGMDENMVALAYEYCLDAIHKVSFPYMDGIMSRWNEIGIHTIEAAEKDREDFKSKNRAKPAESYNTDESSSDFDAIERIIRDKM